MTRDTRTESERRYDAERDGTLYFQTPAEDEDIALAREADQLLEDRAPAPTMRDQILAMLADCRAVPTGDQLFQLLIEDRLTWFIWWRAIDFVLYRQRSGLPVMPAGDRDTVPAALNAHFEAAARQLAQRGAALPEGRALNIACAVERWKRSA